MVKNEIQFIDIEPHLRYWEYGEADHTDDLGGYTKHGITTRYYPDLDIKNLNWEDALEIYKKDFWNKAKVDSFPSKHRIQYFDMCVNMGNKNAVKVMQKAINEILIGKKLIEDGALGKNTLLAYSRTGELLDPEWVATYRMLYYRHITAMRPANESFIKGWFRRTADALAVTINTL